MEFEIIQVVLIIVGFSIKWSKGYVAGVNPKLMTTEATISHPEADYKIDHQKFVESTRRQNLISTTTSGYYENSRIIFPPPSDNAYSYKRNFSTVEQERTREETALRSFPTISDNQKISARPFERDDDDDRPIWSS